MVQWLELGASTAGGKDLIPGQGTKIPHAGGAPKKKDLFFPVTNGLGFPGGTVVGNPPANAGDVGSSPGPGRSRMPQGN